MKRNEVVLSFDDCLFILGALRHYKNHLCSEIEINEKMLLDDSSESFLNYLRDKLKSCDRVFACLFDSMS